MATETGGISIVGRLAPSPTGALHLGNARSFLLAWLSARQQAGKLLLRIEDIDSPRVKTWALESTIEDLAWLGLDWDAGPELVKATSCQAKTDCDMVYVQSQRLERYQRVLGKLIDEQVVYPCVCSRSDVATAASAPHQVVNAGQSVNPDQPLNPHRHLDPLEGTIYPGTCKAHCVDISSVQQYAWRFNLPDAMVTWVDTLKGRIQANPARQLGDFVIAKGDGTPAYQLAVVVDDHDMGVTEVIRGDDLIYSTFRQLAIHQQLGWRAPKYVHVPLVVGPDGRRLAKRHGDTRIGFLREEGISSEAIVGYLAASLGLLPSAVRCRPSDLVGRLDWRKIPIEPTVFSLQTRLPELKSISRRSP